MQDKINSLFDALWNDYVNVAPAALKIHELLANETPLHNDHIALRTVRSDLIGLPIVSKIFFDLGYVSVDEYHFENKKLYAQHLEHPEFDVPKVFISELILNDCSELVQSHIKPLLKDLNPKITEAEDFVYSGRHWDIDYQVYKLLREESEYAAWFYVWGFRANHFTVSLNHLKPTPNLTEINQKLKLSGFKLNVSGGEIKGSPEQGLEQSSTLADEVWVMFDTAYYSIPGCFYEFALRHKMDDGLLYQGFVTSSADKIFESSNAVR
jgi:hypothetical protein